MSVPGKDPQPREVPQTISGKEWDRLRDSLPFPAEPDGQTVPELVRGIRFSHQRQRRDQS